MSHPFSGSFAGRLTQAFRYAEGLLRFRADDAIIASFPRSGSTYLRRLLAEAMRCEDAHSSQEDDSLSFAEVNARMPEWGGRYRWPSQGPRFIKTHRPFTRLLHQRRVVWLVRDPLDTLASYHRYWSARVDVRPIGRDRFLRHPRFGLYRWIRHTRSWEHSAKHRISYEQLRREPEKVTARVLQIVGITVSGDSLATAARRASLDQVRHSQNAFGIDAQVPLRDDFVFAIGTRPGIGKHYFTKECVRWAERLLESEELPEAVWLPSVS